MSFSGIPAFPLEFETRSSITRGLSLVVVRDSSRGDLPAASEPARFIYAALEPRYPSPFRSWYRSSFQEGLALKDILASRRDSFFTDFRAYLSWQRSLGGSVEPSPWYFEGRQFVAYRGRGFLTLGLRRGVFTGTSDFSDSLRFVVVDEKARKELSPGDLFLEGWAQALSPLLAASAREELGVGEASPLAQSGLSSEAPRPSGDFFLYSAGLGFHYAPGELAPTEAGEFFLLLPFDRIASLLKPEARLRLALGGENSLPPKAVRP